MTMVEADDIPLNGHHLQAIRAHFGQVTGERWLGSLSVRFESIKQYYSITIDEVLRGGALSVCWKGTDENGDCVVLKVPFDIAIGRQEVMALRMLSPSGVTPTALHSDRRNGSFLMSYIDNSEPFVGVQNVKEVPLYLDTISRIHHIPITTAAETRTCRIPSLATRLQERLEWARNRRNRSVPGYQQMVSHMGSDIKCREDQLVHGDLQVKNMICGSQHPWIIDPMISRGDQAFDIAMWIVLQPSPIPIKDLLLIAQRQLHHAIYARVERWVTWIAVIELREGDELFDRQMHYLADRRSVDKVHEKWHDAL